MSTIWVDLLGAKVGFYDAAGISTRCIEAGDGPPVIMLHGVGGHAEAYARNVMPLSRRFRAMAIDYLGFGLTDKPDEPPTRDRYVRHLLDFMDAAGIEKAHLVGESLGGWIATWTALQHPDRVDKLVSVCGARIEVETDPESARHVESGRQELKRLTRQFIDNPTRDNVRKRLGWLFHDPADITEELVDIRWALYQRADAQKSLRRSADQMEQGDKPEEIGLTAERLAQISHPTFMLWTSHNPSTPAATAERATAHIPDAKFTVMQDCGHWPQWEDPDTFNQLVEDFLAG